MKANILLRPRSIDCHIPLRKTHVEVEVVETVGDLERVRERLRVTLSGNYRDFDAEGFHEALRAKVEENAAALGLEE